MILNQLPFGMRIVESPGMVDRKQNRKHHKKRINKKWAKRYGFSTTPKTVVLLLGDTLYMHPVMASTLRKALAARND